MIFNKRLFRIGGGSAEVLTGTFTTGSGTGTVELDTGYTGNGYPVALIAFVDDADFYSQTGTGTNGRAYIVGVLKNYPLMSPTYEASGNANSANLFRGYRSSTGSTNTAINLLSLSGCYMDSAAASSSMVRIRNNHTISIMHAANTQRYFYPDKEFRYYIVYRE